MPSEEPIVYAGCYVLKWGREDEPTMGFIPIEDDEYDAECDRLYTCINNALMEINKAPRPIVGPSNTLAGYYIGLLVDIEAKLKECYDR